MYDPAVPSPPMPSEHCFSKSVIEDITGLRFSDNNTLRLLESGQETFDEIFKAVSNAQDIICMEFYIFKDDNTGKRLAEALMKKAAQGVSVYLLYDHFGSFLTSARFWSGMRKAGIKIRVSHPFKWSAPRGYKYRNHKKLLIIDSNKAFIGGFNIADEYHGHLNKKVTPWRDTGIYIEGPVVSALFSMFVKSWATWNGRPIIHDMESIPSTHGIPVIPVFANSGRERRRMKRLLVYSIKNAKESILITTAYFSPGLRIMRALISAARRGIKLRLLLPGETDVMSVFYAGRSHYNNLLKAGAEIYNYRNSVLHSKTFVFDGCWSIVGSANLDTQSLRMNEESNVGILDAGFGGQMSVSFENDLKRSVRIDLSTWKNRPFYQKVLEKFFFVVMKKL